MPRADDSVLHRSSAYESFDAPDCSWEASLSFFVDDEAGALAFLRYQSVEKVKGHHARRDVDDRADVLA